MFCYIYQLKYKKIFSQSAKLGGILNPPPSVIIHRFQVHAVSLKLRELVMEFTEQSGAFMCRPLWKQASNKAQLLYCPFANDDTGVPQPLMLENISSVQYGRQSADSQRIHSSASNQTATVSCWMGIISSTVLQYFNRII